MKMKTLYIECDCGSFNHLTRFGYFEDDNEFVYLNTQLNHYLPWYKRLWIAINYLFAREVEQCNYTESCISVDTRKQLIAFLQQSLGENNEQ